MQPIIDIRLAMVAHGYTPIPVVGKKPPFVNWQLVTAVSRATIEEWDHKWPRASNTGVLTRLTPTLDLDLLNEPAAVAAENFVRERFETRGRILSRIGFAPKRAIPLRTNQPFKKLSTLFAVSAGVNSRKGEKIEFLGDGQQVVAHGIHPDTQREYLWTGGDPSTVAYSDLPEISAAEAEQLQNDIAALLVRDFGYVVAKEAWANGGAKPKRAKAARKNAARDEAWARAALDDECAKIAMAPPSTRNDALNLGAFSIFQIIAGTPGVLDEEEVRQRLFAAAEACGLVEDDGAAQCWATIESGEKGGRASPRVRPQLQIVSGGLNLNLASAGQGAGAAAGTAGAAGTATTMAGRRIVKVRDGDKSAMLDEVEQELVRHQGFGLYQRGGQLVRTILIRTADADNRSTLIWRLAPIDHAHLFEVFTRIIDFQKYDRRSRAWVSTDCPSQLPAMYEGRRHWQVPTLLGVVHTPQLRADGSLVEAAGYDPGTRLQFKFDGEIFPPISAHPTRADADAALKLIEEAISTFPFKTAVDRAVALSLFLTALARRSFEPSSHAAPVNPARFEPRGGTMTDAQVTPGSSPIRPAKDRNKSATTNGRMLPGIDGRNAWARRARDVLREHISDLGGEENTSAAERSLGRRAAALSTELEMLEAKFARAGHAEAEDLDLYIRASGGLRRLLESVGLQRRAREVGKFVDGKIQEPPSLPSEFRVIDHEPAS